MTSLLGDVPDSFGDCGLIWYDFMSEQVSNNNAYLLIDTGGVI